MSDTIRIRGARENNLKVANKPDSEDICFITDCYGLQSIGIQTNNKKNEIPDLYRNF